jgi:hypothetical protein
LIAVNRHDISSELANEMKTAINEEASELIPDDTDVNVPSFNFPEYYRNLYNFTSRKGHRPFEDHVQDLLGNTLVLLPTAKAGEGEFERYFLRCDLHPEDFPWDTEQTDW